MFIREGNGTLLQYSRLENPMDGGAWWAAVHGVAKSRTRLSDFTFIFTFMHWRRKWQPTPVLLPGESQGRGNLVGCYLWGRTESDTTEETQQQNVHSNSICNCHKIGNHPVSISCSLDKYSGVNTDNRTLYHRTGHSHTKQHGRVTQTLLSKGAKQKKNTAHR